MKWLGAAVIVLWSSHARAVQCVDVFPYPVSTFSTDGELEMMLLLMWRCYTVNLSR